MAPTLKMFGVVSRFLYSGGWQVCPPPPPQTPRHMDFPAYDISRIPIIFPPSNLIFIYFIFPIIKRVHIE